MTKEVAPGAAESSLGTIRRNQSESRANPEKAGLRDVSKGQYQPSSEARMTPVTWTWGLPVPALLGLWL